MIVAVHVSDLSAFAAIPAGVGVYALNMRSVRHVASDLRPAWGVAVLSLSVMGACQGQAVLLLSP